MRCWPEACNLHAHGAPNVPSRPLKNERHKTGRTVWPSREDAEQPRKVVDLHFCHTARPCRVLTHSGPIAVVRSTTSAQFGLTGQGAGTVIADRRVRRVAEDAPWRWIACSFQWACRWWTSSSNTAPKRTAGVYSSGRADRGASCACAASHAKQPASCVGRCHTGNFSQLQ